MSKKFKLILGTVETLSIKHENFVRNFFEHFYKNYRKYFPINRNNIFVYQYYDYFKTEFQVKDIKNNKILYVTFNIPRFWNHLLDIKISDKKNFCSRVYHYQTANKASVKKLAKLILDSIQERNETIKNIRKEISKIDIR